mgnify:CR=1 FL=1
MKTNLLLVDDDEECLLVLATILSMEGYQVFNAENGIIALKVLEESQIDLVVTDVFMPDMEGIGLSRAIRKQYPQMKILGITGCGTMDVTTLRPTMESFFDSVLIKPFKSSALLTEVDKLLKESALEK